MLSCCSPLIDRLGFEVKQRWYAEGASAGGDVQDLKSWWDRLTQLGPQFGYFPNPAKTWLIVKEQHQGAALDAFGDTSINITSQGKRKVECWIDEVTKLALIAKTQPHASYASYIHGLKHRWKFSSGQFLA